MTPLRRELDADGPRDYEQVARQRLTDFATAEGIPYLDFLPRFQSQDYAPLYFDHIHLSHQGNQTVGQALAQWVIDHGEANAAASSPTSTEGSAPDSRLGDVQDPPEPQDLDDLW
jgi:lysophospholipase L1-like esterase